MKQLLQKRLQLQLLFALLAAVCVAALAGEMIVRSVRSAQGFVLSDTHKILHRAIQELRQQESNRIGADQSWRLLPEAARDVSLRAIAGAVLSAYPGVEGGYWNAEQFSGYAYPTHDGGSPKVDVPDAERPVIEQVIREAEAKHSAERVLRGKHDLVVVAAEGGQGSVGWAMKRLPGQAETGQRNSGILVTALVVAALFSASGVLATGVALHRGVSQIKQGLTNLNSNFETSLPARRDELGEISAAINDMAQVRRRLEAELRREDRLRATGRLVAQVAHEMKNPLNNIRLSLQMLQQRLSTSQLRPGDFRMTMDEVDRMNRLLSDLLAFQQPRPANVTVQELAPLLEAVMWRMRPQSEAMGVGLALEIPDGGIAALLDAHYVTQVLTNLVSNALEAAAPGSIVRVAVLDGESGAEVRVTDQGPGLSEEQQEHLFEPFYTTKSSGHGLGLAVSRELARGMNGDLVYRHNPEGGMTFILQLRGMSHAV